MKWLVPSVRLPQLSAHRARRIRRAALDGAMLGLLAGVLSGAYVGEGETPYVVVLGAAGSVLLGTAGGFVSYLRRH